MQLKPGWELRYIPQFFNASPHVLSVAESKVETGMFSVGGR